MTTKDTDLTILKAVNTPSIQDEQELTGELKKAWEHVSPNIKIEAQRKFEEHICNDLEAYLDKLEAACRHHKERSHLFKFLDWLEPFLKLLELFTPAAAIAIQAYPNPGALAMGGIVALLSITSRLQSIQKLTLRMLARMGRKARIFLAYESTVYRNELEVQKALLAVYSDVISFCDRGVSYLTENGKIKGKVKGLRLFLFKDFESRLGAIVENFEHHLEDLEAQACLCDKRRLKEVRDSIKSRDGAGDQISKGSADGFAKSGEEDNKIAQIEHILRKYAEREQNRKKRANMHAWLSPLDFVTKYHDRCDEHLLGTGRWLLKSDLYKAWKSKEKSDLLWVRGKPGCGKSVLAAVAINDISLHLESDASLGYIFCRREEQLGQTSASLLGGLAKQLCESHGITNTVLQTEFERNQRGQQPSLRTARNIIRSIITSLTQAFLVVDALDECANVEELTHELLQLLEQDSKANVKVLILSRPEFHLDKHLQNYPQIRPDHGSNQEDLKTYISSLFEDKNSQSFNQRLRDECISKADGMFLWVKLLERSLDRPLLPVQKLQLIQKIPAGLASMYDKILHDIWHQGEEVWSNAFKVLLWVTHSKRPLTKIELWEALTDFSGVRRVRDASRYEKPEDLVNMCMNLVVIDKDETFRLCHDSVRGYLDKPADNSNVPLAHYQRRRRRAHQEIAETCIRYLSLNDFDRGPFTFLTNLRRFCRRFPLLSYAARVWGFHVGQANADGLQDVVLSLVLPSNRRNFLIQIAAVDDEDVPFSRSSDRPSSHLHILSLFGLVRVAEGLTDIDKSAYQPDGFGMIPLIYAMIREHYDMSKWLLEQDHTINLLRHMPQRKNQAILLSTNFGWVDLLQKLVGDEQDWLNCRSPSSATSPLIAACNNGQLGAATFLVTRGARLDLKRSDGDDALMVSTQRGHIDIVRLLLENGADAQTRDANGATVLHHAAGSGLKEISTLLLDFDADPLATTSTADGLTPLHFAAESQSLLVISALHQRNAKLDVKTNNGYTPLHIAAWHNCPHAARHLLRLGASKNETDSDGRTPLYIAASEGAFETVQVLVEAGCDMTKLDREGASLLHAAVGGQNTNVVDYIISNLSPGALMPLVKCEASQRETALHHAMHTGSADIVKLLLEAGADPAAEGIMQSSALHYAAHYGHQNIMRHLLKAIGDVNNRNEDGDTPLHFATIALNLDWIVDFFHQCEVNGLSISVDALNNSKKTALMLALYQSAEDIAKFLLDKYDKMPSGPDGDDNCAIHLAAWHGLDNIVSALMQHEDTRKKGYFGRTPLLIAAMNGRLSTVNLLLDQTPDLLEIPADDGSTPVLAALRNSHLLVAHRLLDAGADWKVVDKYNNGLLHWAARTGDLKILERLLSLGCEANEKNSDNDTPFHLAVSADSIEIVKVLIQKGFDYTNIPGFHENTCIMIAASNGSEEMLHLLAQRGAVFGKMNALGRTAAYFAADKGQWEILDFLKMHGEDLHAADLQGETPLMIATRDGYVDTVRSLLKDSSEGVNSVSNQYRISALGEATQNGWMKTARVLLEAGADPFLRDAFGANAFIYASAWPSTLAELYREHRSQDDFSGDTQLILYNTVIRSCGNLLSSSPAQQSLENEYNLLHSVGVLAHALMILKDYETAKKALAAALWPIKVAQLSFLYTCELCSTVRFSGALRVCKRCPSLLVLCEGCHEDYEDADRETPEAISEITKIESNVLPLRALAKGFPLSKITCALKYFEAGSRWLSTTIEEYEAWERKYNEESKYACVDRPGHELLKQISQMWDHICDTVTNTDRSSNSSQRLDELHKSYRKYESKNHPDKEIPTFPCSKHEFMVLTRDEASQFYGNAEVFDSVTGGLTSSWISKIRDRYERLAGYGESSRGQVGTNMNLLQPDRNLAESAQPMTLASETRTGINMRNWSPLVRSQSAYFGTSNTVRSNATDVPAVFSLKSLIAKPDEIEPHRAQSLPITDKMSSVPRAQNLEIQVKAAGILAKGTEVEQSTRAEGYQLPDARLEHERSGMKHVSIALFDPSGIPSNERTSDAKESNAQNSEAARHSVLSDEGALTMTLSHEPTEIDPGEDRSGPSKYTMSWQTQNDGNVGTFDPEALSSSESEDFLRSSYVAFNENDCDDEDVRLWILALMLTDVVRPGFVKRFFTAKLEELENHDLEETDEANLTLHATSNEDAGDDSGSGFSDENDD